MLVVACVAPEVGSFQTNVAAVELEKVASKM